MTLADRVQAYNDGPWGRKYPASRLHVVQEQGRDVIYGTWLLGNNYKNKVGYYGEYPPGYLARVGTLFPDVRQTPREVLHVFSGSLPKGRYTRLDLNPRCGPDVVGTVYNIGRIFPFTFALVFADPPYSEADATHYGTPMVDRRRALAALANVVEVGRHLCWLDCVWPMFRKAEWRTVGRIVVIRCTNHRVRLCSIFERVA